jgi:NADH:ubiquinone oxidoreductase subunit C
MRQPVVDQAPHTNTVHVAEELKGSDVPLEFEVVVVLPQGKTPSVPSVQSIWVGADWNEKETWDLVGIQFEGHDNMHRVLNPHDSPEGFHPLQKQHKIRYHDFNEMYDDAKGFGRKPTDEGRVK